ncbi:MAG: aminotransferase class I and II, partial [Bacteroidota bacterium]|nr:aminotransferase class I and II [Bacteroidota bacterium]
HGASLYFHHAWTNWEEQSLRPFLQVKDHVLLPWATELNLVDEAFRTILTAECIRSIVALIPDEWLVSESVVSIEEGRKVYEQFLMNRISNSFIFINEAQHAREAVI